MQQSELVLLSAFWSNGRKAKPKGRFSHYQIDLCDPYGHYFEVTLTVTEVGADQRFSLPVWIPGSYMVRDFAKHIVDVRAESAGSPVQFQMVDKSTWQCAEAHDELSITLKIYAFDNSVRAAWFDEQRAFINGTSAFLRVLGRENEPCLVDVSAPTHPALQGWRLATGLDVVDAPEWGFGSFSADNYHALIDHPLEAGNFELLAFEAAAVPHVMLFAGDMPDDFCADRLAKDVGKICETHIRRFEPDTSAAPFNRYLFMTNVFVGGYGGLEHRNSTALVCAPKDLPLSLDGEASPEYQQFLGLCSHEYFHAWNVKRITPAAFSEPDYQSENYSTLLWAFEGITSYYDDLGVYESGCVPVDAWMRAFGEIVTRVYRGQGRHGQSVADSSFTTWTRFYQQDANAPNAIVSYYAKGALVALCLDLKLRLLSASQVTLEDLMRKLWSDFGKPAEGLAENAIEQAAKSLLPSHEVELEGFFEMAVRGTTDLPIESLLAEFGVCLNWRAQKGAADKGGVDGDAWRVWVGAQTKTVGNELELVRVDNDSPAHKAGLSLKDRLVAINGRRASAEWIQQQLDRAEPGTEWQLTLFREQTLLDKTLHLDAAPKTTAWLSLNESASSTQKQRRQEWLSC